MLIIESLLLGILSSALVAWVDRQDQEDQESDNARRQQLREAAERLRTPAEKAQAVLNEAFRVHGTSGSPIAEVAKCIGGDPVWGHDLVLWILEHDPECADQKRLSLAQSLSEATQVSSEDIEPFLEGVYNRLNAHPELANLRADKKLNSVLVQLRELDGLKDLVAGHHAYVANQLQKLLDAERLQHLVPVSPSYRPPSKINGLLHGNRPSDKDMDEDLDFRRTKFPEVMRDIKAASRLPAAFVFLADPQRGKTTFLKRVGWELAKEGYSVVQLQAGSRREAYARWLIDAAETVPKRPLVVLIDDPHRDKDHFQDQMNTLSDREPHVICLVASRTVDWQQIEADRIPLLSSAQRYSLDPDRYESGEALKKLVASGLVQVDPERLRDLIRELNALPFGGGYFSQVIQVASEDRFRPMPLLVEERLGEAAGTAEASAFESLYGFVCLFGVVGLPMSEDVVSSILPVAELAAALRFSGSFPNPPIQLDKTFLMATHEVHAAVFFHSRDYRGQLICALRHSFEHGGIRSSLGRLLGILTERGAERLALDAWDLVANDLPDRYWQDCDVESLAYHWAGFFAHNQRHRMALTVTSLAVEEFMSCSESSTQNAVVSALNSKGFFLATLGRHEEAVDAFDVLLRTYGDRKEPAILDRVLKAQHNKGKSLGILGHHEEAISVYDALVRRYDEHDELFIVEMVAQALIEKGVSLGVLGQDEDAVTVYDTVVEQYGESEEITLVERVVSAQHNKIVSLASLGRHKEAIAVSENLMNCFGESEEPYVQERVMRAQYNKAVSLSVLGRHEETVSVYHALVERFGEEEDLSYQEWVAKAHTNKGLSLWLLGRQEEAVKIFDAVVERYGGSRETLLQVQVARAIESKGLASGDLGLREEENSAYDAIVERFEDSADLSLRTRVASALALKGSRLASSGQREEAIKAYDSVIERFEEAEELPLQELTVKAQYYRGITLAAMGRHEEAVKAYGAVAERLEENELFSLNGLAGGVQRGRGMSLAALERHEEAIEAFGASVQLFGNLKELTPQGQGQVASSFFFRGMSLGHLKRYEDAIASFDTVEEWFRASEDFSLQEWLARSLYLKTECFMALGRYEEAVTTSGALIDRYRNNQEPSLQELVLSALQQKSHAQMKISPSSGRD